MSVWLWMIAIVAGATGQFLDALAGMGFGALSGTIMVSGGIAPAVVVATVNLAKVGSGLVSGLAHMRLGNVRWSWVLPMVVPAVAGGTMSGLMVTRLPTRAVEVLVPLVLLMMGALVLRRFLLPNLSQPPMVAGGQDLAAVITRRPWHILLGTRSGAGPSLWLSLISFVGGVMNGLSGAFGPFVTSAVVMRHKGHPRFAIGTVNFVEFFVAGAISITILSQIPWHLFHWSLPLALTVGSLVTAPLGAYLSRHLPARAVGVVVGLTLIALNTWSLIRQAL